MYQQMVPPNEAERLLTADIMCLIPKLSNTIWRDALQPMQRPEQENKQMSPLLHVRVAHWCVAEFIKRHIMHPTSY